MHVQVTLTDKAGARLVQRIVPDDVGEIAELAGHGLHGTQVVALEELLGRLPLDAHLRGQVVPGEKEGPHGAGRQPDVVGEPRHLRVLIALRPMQEGRAAFGQVRQVKAHGLQGPARRAIAAGEAAPHVLVKVNKDLDAVVGGPAHHLVQVVQVRLIVAAGAGVLHGLPGGEEAQEGEAPGAEPGIVLGGLVQGEGPADEGDVAVVVHAFGDVSGAVGGIGHFGTAAQIRAA